MMVNEPDDPLESPMDDDSRHGNHTPELPGTGDGETETDEPNITHLFPNAVDLDADGVARVTWQLKCSHLIGASREQLEGLEQMGPMPSLRTCGNHFLEIPDTPHGS